MTKQNPAEPVTLSAKKPLHWGLELVCSGAAWGTAYVFASLAINTGKLQYYAATLFFAGLGVYHDIRSFRAWRRANGQ